MFLNLYVAAMARWRELTETDESERGDSPVPTVVLWIGIALIAIALLAWASTYVLNYANSAPTAP
jgi:hypothetical protein